MVKKVLKVIRWVLSLTFISTILAVVVYRFIPVYFTPLMISRCFEQIGKGESVKLYHDWIPLEKIKGFLHIMDLTIKRLKRQLKTT